MSDRWPVILLGGSGYVGGEMLRLLAQHPRLTLRAVVSTSLAGQPVAASLPHLAPIYPDTRFVSPDAAEAQLGQAPHWVLLSAAPHGASAPLIDRLLSSAQSLGVELSVVDASADYRFASAAQYADVYGHEHPAPQRLSEFRCALPEHLAELDRPHVAHPGCFSTAMLLGIVPLLAARLTGDDFHVSAVTGSTGAGRTPTETTHHPQRQANLFAYKPLKHRHAPEVQALTEALTGRSIRLGFVPHSGPFARGIHATIFAHARGPLSTDDVNEVLAEHYRGSNFVKVTASTPRLKDVATSNYALIHASVEDDTVVVCCVIDNLVKGAAGGCLQWVNRVLGLPDSEGLTAPAPGWT